MASERSRQVVIAVASSVVSVALSWLAFQHFAAPKPAVDMVDNRAEVEALLRSREAEAAATPPATTNAPNAWPPPLVREPLDLATAQTFFPLAGLKRPYDPRYFYARAPNQEFTVDLPDGPGSYVVRTNSEGFRHDGEFLAEKPDLRVVVTGDSHVDGVCANDESIAAQLGNLLRADDPARSVESINMGIGGYHFYNYLGVLERALELSPDVFIVIVYGGNDFHGMMSLQRYFHRRPAPDPDFVPPALTSSDPTRAGIGAQDLIQACYFAKNPEDVQVASDTAASITAEMQRLCEARGVHLVCVYLPPASSGQPRLEQRIHDELVAAAGLTPEQARISDGLGDEWLAFCRLRGIPYFDLRPLFRSNEVRLYNASDRHLTVRANLLVAKVLDGMIQAILR